MIIVDHTSSGETDITAELYYLIGASGLIDNTSSTAITGLSGSYRYENTWGLYSFEGAWWPQTTNGNSFNYSPNTLMYKRLPEETTYHSVRPEVGQTATIYYGIVGGYCTGSLPCVDADTDVTGAIIYGTDYNSGMTEFTFAAASSLSVATAVASAFVATMF